MALPLTKLARNASDQQSIRPQIILEIEGVTQRYSATIVKKIIRINDPDLAIGTPLPFADDVWTIGGLRPVENQSPLISFGENSLTSSTIRQNLNLDKGEGETISSVQIELVDKNLEITELITPGEVVDDLLSRRCKLWLGFEDTTFKDDFIVIFRGIIDDISSGPGNIILNIAHPDQKKRSQVYQKATSNISAAMSAGQTTITVDDASNFPVPVNGPDGTRDTTIQFYLKIDDEIMEYSALTGNDFTITRGDLGTTAATHDADAQVESIIELTGNSVDLALKIMLSGVNGDYLEDLDVFSIETIVGEPSVDNALVFDGLNIELEHGVTVGDYVTVTGATNAANNFTGRQVTEIGSSLTGTYVVVDGADLVAETGTSATVSFRSQYDTLGIGLSMIPEEVDIAEHLQLKQQFLTTFEYNFIIEDNDISGKEFITNQIYNPAAAYSIPRNSRASLGVHIPPLPTAEIPRLDTSNIKNPSQLRLKRTTNRNFYNTVVYQIDKELGSDRFLTNVINFSADSRNRIKRGNVILPIQSQGMRSDNLGEINALSAGSRRLAKFQFGAEFVKNVKVHFREGFNLEIGDIVELDFESLKLSDIQSGTRSGDSRLMQITNKVVNIGTGDVSLDLVDTNFDKEARYGLISPSSQVKSGISNTSFIIESGPFSDPFDGEEFRKWDLFIGSTLLVRSSDHSTRGTAKLSQIIGNQLVVESSLGFTPTNGMIVEFDEYQNQTDEVQLRYVFMSDTDFADGKSQYLML